jgi:hypothetical protein
MSPMTKSAHDLLSALGLTVVAGGPNGRYPRAVPGPANGYRYWATTNGGEFRLGFQAQPKAKLSPSLQRRLEDAGFALTPARTEGFITVGSNFDAAIDQGRVVMARLEELLQGH